VAAADQGFLKEAPGERGGPRSGEQGKNAYRELAETVEPGLGMEKNAVGEKAEGGVEQVRYPPPTAHYPIRTMGNFLPTRIPFALKHLQNAFSATSLFP